MSAPFGVRPKVEFLVWPVYVALRDAHGVESGRAQITWELRDLDDGRGAHMIGRARLHLEAGEWVSQTFHMQPTGDIPPVRAIDLPHPLRWPRGGVVDVDPIIMD